MYRIFLTALVLYFIAAAGLFGGAAIGSFLPGVRLWRNILLSLAGGMAGALVCFELFPAAVASSGLYFTMAAVMLGILLAYLAETKTSSPESYNETFLYLLSCGISAGLFLNSTEISLSVPLIIAASLVPSGIGLMSDRVVPSGIELMSDRVVPSGIELALFRPFLIALIMAAGGFAGALMSFMPRPIPSAFLSAAAGVILYISCGTGGTAAENEGRVREIISWAAVIAGFIFAALVIYS